MSASFLTFPNPDFSFQLWYRGQSWNNKLEKHWWSTMSECSHWWCLFHKKSEEMRLYICTTWFIDFIISTHGLSAFSNACPGWTVRFFFFFGCDDRGLLKEGVKAYLMAPMTSRNFPPCFLSSHLNHTNQMNIAQMLLHSVNTSACFLAVGLWSADIYVVFYSFIFIFWLPKKTYVIAHHYSSFIFL